MASARSPLAQGSSRLGSPASCTRSYLASSRKPQARPLRACTTTWPSAKPAPQTRRRGLTTKSDGEVEVAIVGGGASGTILAAQLARRGIKSVLIDGSGRAGVGVAYSTIEPAHLLNVRAEGMSALADDPDHFVRRFEAEGGNRRGFAERRLFGRYLREMLSDATDKGCASIEQSTAVSARRDGGTWHVELDDGRTVSAAALALAIGNQDPEPLRALAGAGDRF